ncbi:hypothetical protein [Streptomyces hydrogenans]|nr:hypothetical protein [Streptomyces hydrogenans]
MVQGLRAGGAEGGVGVAVVLAAGAGARVEERDGQAERGGR